MASAGTAKPTAPAGWATTRAARRRWKWPAALGGAPLLLQDRAGGGTDNLKVTDDAVNAPGLAGLKGTDPSGTWTLEVSDTARADRGTLRSLRLELSF